MREKHCCAIVYSRSAADSAAEQAASSSRTRTALVILLLLMMWHLEKGFKEDYLRFPRKFIFFEFGLFSPDLGGFRERERM